MCVECFVGSTGDEAIEVWFNVIEKVSKIQMRRFFFWGSAGVLMTLQPDLSFPLCWTQLEPFSLKNPHGVDVNCASALFFGLLEVGW